MIDLIALLREARSRLIASDKYASGWKLPGVHTELIEKIDAALAEYERLEDDRSVAIAERST